MKKDLRESVEANLRAYFKIHGTHTPAEGLYTRVLKEIEEPLLRITLSYVDFNYKKASKILGIHRNTLRQKMKELHIENENKK